MKNEYLLGGIGATLGAVGTATQLNEVLQTISLIVTILGAVVSFIIVPLVSWYAKAKKDGEITAEELADAAETLKEGLEKTNEQIKKGDSDNGEVH